MGTITKALSLLNFFSASRPEIGLSQFVRLSNRDKATVLRHLTELKDNGFLEQVADTRCYRLGPAVLRLSALREVTYPVKKLLQPIIADLASAVGELAHASLLQGDMLSPVCHADPKLHGTQVHFDEAELLPLHATASGMAVLAFAEPDLAEKILTNPLAAHTPQTLTHADTIRSTIGDVRLRGVSRLSGTFDEEVSSQAAPLFEQNGAVIGSIAVAVPIVRATKASFRAIEFELLAAAQAASHSLGGTYPNFPAFSSPTSQEA